MQEIIMTHGLPASGKSTWAKDFLSKHTDYVRINRDDLRNMFADKKTHHIEKFENFITDMQCRLITGCLVRGNNLIIDDTNLSYKTVQTIGNTISQYCNDYNTVVRSTSKVFDVDSDECIARDKKRERPVGADVIHKLSKDLSACKKHGMFDQLINTIQPIIGTPETSNTQCVICDLDGTLALVTDRNVYDTANCERDLLNEPLWNCIIALVEFGYKLLIVTGRSDAYKKQTESWLKANNITYDGLYMRKQGDSRKDAVVKSEIYVNQIAPNYYAYIVFDDRNQVVNMWRNMGLTCFQVNPGDF